PSRRNEGLNALTWKYREVGAHREPEIEEVLQEINGRRVADGSLLEDYTKLEADGSTSCGCWIYSGVFPRPGHEHNEAARRAPEDLYGRGWGYASPLDPPIPHNPA